MNSAFGAAAEEKQNGRFASTSEKEILLMDEEVVPKNTKMAKSI